MTNKSILAMGVAMALLTVFSCNRSTSEKDLRIMFSVNDFREAGESSGVTRTSLVNGTNFVWSENDTVGIYPNTGGQVYFAMAAGAGTKNASFDGGGWEFKSSAVYYSYYPFIGNTYLDRHHIPVSYLGQSQPTATSIDHIGRYDFMATPGTTAESGGLAFNYSHLNCLIRVTAKLPAGTYTRMTLKSPDNDFTVKGYYDLMSSNPSIIPVVMSNSLSITLNSITLDTESNLVVYMMTAPVNLKGKEIIVTFETATATFYSQAKTPSRVYEAETIGGLTCADMKRTGDTINGVGVDDYYLGDDDEVIIINQ
jgi:hypothetical protein